MNADHAEAVEFGKQSKRENRVYVGNLSYDVRYRDLIEFMRGGGSGQQFSFVSVRRRMRSSGRGSGGMASLETGPLWPRPWFSNSRKLGTIL